MSLFDKFKKAVRGEISGSNAFSDKVNEDALTINDPEGKYALMQDVAKNFLDGRCIEISSQHIMQNESVVKQTAVVITVYSQKDKHKEPEDRLFFAMKADYDKNATQQLFSDLLETAIWGFDNNKRANKGSTYNLCIGKNFLMGLTREEFFDNTLNCLSKNKKIVAECFEDMLRKMNTNFIEKCFIGGTCVTVPFENKEIICEFTGASGKNLSMFLAYAKVPENCISEISSLCQQYNSGPYEVHLSINNMDGVPVLCLELNDVINFVTCDKAGADVFWKYNMLVNVANEIKNPFYMAILK